MIIDYPMFSFTCKHYLFILRSRWKRLTNWVSCWKLWYNQLRKYSMPVKLQDYCSRWFPEINLLFNGLHADSRWQNGTTASQLYQESPGSDNNGGGVFVLGLVCVYQCCLVSSRSPCIELQPVAVSSVPSQLCKDICIWLNPCSPLGRIVMSSGLQARQESCSSIASPDFTVETVNPVVAMYSRYAFLASSSWVLPHWRLGAFNVEQ